jgi:hypothetical protein
MWRRRLKKVAGGSILRLRPRRLDKLPPKYNKNRGKWYPTPRGYGTGPVERIREATDDEIRAKRASHALGLYKGMEDNGETDVVRPVW